MSTVPAVPPVPAVPAAVLRDPARARHYGVFYGLEPVPTDRPLLVVHGNCQAESLRVVLQGAGDAASGAPCTSVRMPAVHEIADDEVALLQRLLLAARWVVTQPIADDYHGLPLGSAQVAAAAPDATTVVFPVFRYAGLFPWQVVHHHEGVGDPPVVPYHDARTLLEAAGLPPAATTPDGIRAVAEWSLAELARREMQADAVPVHDLVGPAGSGAAHTVNHPGNPVVVGLARRIEAALGWDERATDPGRVLLDGIHTPLEPQVREALGLAAASASSGHGDPESDAWVVNGARMLAKTIRAAQLAWYGEHPEVVEHLLTKAGTQLRLLGATGLPS